MRDLKKRYSGKPLILLTGVMVFAASLFPGAARGQSQFKKVGTTGFVFLEIPVSARTAALGEASITTEDGAQGVFSNPALLGKLPDQNSVGVSVADWFAETKHQSFAYAFNGGSVGVLGISVDRLDLGTMQRTENGKNQGSYNILGTFTADAMAVGVNFARQMTDRFAFGGTVKYVQERIAEYKSTNALFDAGIVYNTGFYSLRIGGAVRNFGVDAKYLEGLFKMPTDFRLGASANVVGDESSLHRVNVAVEASHPSDNDERLQAGLEYWFSHVVALRAGHKWNYDEEEWTSGIGLRWVPLTLDVAYAQYGRLGSVVRFTLGATL